MKFNRWVYVGVGFIVMLCSGMVYAWTNISKPIKAEILVNNTLNISASNLTLTFSICMALFCLGGLSGGMIIKKISAKVNIVIAAILFPTGLAIAANSYSYVGLYIGYGICVGFAAGLVYNAVLSVVTKWFQDIQGTVSGVLLMGFGLGGFVLGPVAKMLSDSMGWRTSFIVIGIAFSIILLISVFFFVLPGDDYITPVKTKNKSAPVIQGALDIGPMQMIKRPSFWFFFLWSLMLSTAGLSIVPYTNDFAHSVIGMDAMLLVVVAGIVSVFNGFGKFVFGCITDKKGNRFTIIADSILFLVASLILILAYLLSSLLFTIIGFVCVGLAFGGVPSNSSTFANAFYGNRNYPLNFPITTLSLLFASFIGPNISQSFLGSSIGFIGVIGAMATYSIISLIVGLFIKRP